MPTTPWSDAKAQCAMDALGESLREGVEIPLGVLQDVINHDYFLAIFDLLTRQ